MPSTWPWWALGGILASTVFLWTLFTQPSPFLPVLELLAWSGVVRCWARSGCHLRLVPSRVSASLSGLVLAAVAGVLLLARPTSLAYGLPLAVGLAMALLALPLRQLWRAAKPLALLTIPAFPLLLRWVLPEPLLSRATASTSAFLLQLIGLDALALGPYLALGDGGVRVAGACGGTEDIAFLLAVALLLTLTQPPLVFQRVAFLVLLAPCLGFLVNAIRVALLAVVFRQGGWWTQQAFPSLHEGYGALLFSFIAVVVLVWMDGLVRSRWLVSLKNSSTA